MYCDMVAENTTIENGRIIYSETFPVGNMSYSRINTTYHVECDSGYIPANAEPVQCVLDSLQNTSRWNGNLTNCSK